MRYDFTNSAYRSLFQSYEAWKSENPNAYRNLTAEYTGVLAAAAPHLQRQARSDALKEAADEIHTEARWQTEQRIRLAQISDVRASTSYGISLSRLALLEKILLDRIPEPVQRSSNDD